MRSIRRSTDALTAALALAATALLLNGLACSDPLRAPIAAVHAEDATPRRGGALRLASIGEPAGFDPATINGGLSTPIVNLLYDGLVDYDEDSRIVPVLAERWEIADEGRMYRFFLREGVRFHDGEELTADDVRRSIERALDPGTPGPFASNYSNIAGYKELVAKTAPHLRGVRVEGRYVVSIELEHADAVFLPSLTLYPLRPVCKSAGERYARGWEPCGAGPFRLEPGGWVHGNSITVVRNERYFRAGSPYVDSVTWLLGVTPVTQRLKFSAGEIDYLRDLTGYDWVRYRGDPRWKAYGDDEPAATMSGEAMNTQMAPFDNVEVRRAVAAAINRDHYVAVKPVALIAADQPLPPGVPARDPAVVGQRYDYAAALEHMRRAGYAYDPVTGKGGYPHVVRYTGYEGSLSYYTSQVLQQELARIGIRIEIRMLGFATYNAVVHRPGLSPFMVAGWDQDYRDPSDFFDPIFGSAAINDEQTYNLAFYRSLRLDELLERGRRETDLAVRQATYAEATRIVCDDAPWAFTHYYHYFSVHQPYLRGYRPRPVSPTYVANVWLDRAASAVAERAAPIFRDATGSLFGARAHAPGTP